MPVFLLSGAISFPPVYLAEPDGLLAIGGDLTAKRLLLAYREGIFPWYSEGNPILWWSPDPRLVLYPDEIHISRSLRKELGRRRFKVTTDRAFHSVIRQCAAIRLETGDSTWLNREMILAYDRLFELGLAHSIEVWQQSSLIGGLYGLALGRCFFGESMFSRVNNASKTALVALCRHLQGEGFGLIDCQVASDHLMRLGAREIPRSRFLSELKKLLTFTDVSGRWTFMEDLLNIEGNSSQTASLLEITTDKG
jgi:leucyl/phenylalanyl-tRNA--protein transferase